MSQLTILDINAPHCPFKHRLDPGDNHCNSIGIEKPGYEVLSEDHPDFDEWLAVVRGIDLGNVRAADIPVPDFSDTGYIPTIRRGDGSLFEKYKPKYVGIRLQDVVSPQELRVPETLARFELPDGTLPILQCYGSDLLIENLWPYRREVFKRLTKLGFVAATSVNYSMWNDQPHAERLINVKRGLLTFEDWQNVGMPTIPHIYWHGHKDLDAWAAWLHDNPNVAVTAINLQTIRQNAEWDRTVEQLRYFVSKLSRPVHFLINGPATLHRIEQLREVFPSFTLSNAYASRMAAAGQLLRTEDDVILAGYSSAVRSDIFRSNNQFYEQYLRRMKAKRTGRMQATKSTRRAL